MNDLFIFLLVLMDSYFVVFASSIFSLLRVDPSSLLLPVERVELVVTLVLKEWFPIRND